MGCVDGGVVGQRGVLSTRTVSRFVGGTSIIVPPMIGVPLCTGTDNLGGPSLRFGI